MFSAFWKKKIMEHNKLKQKPRNIYRYYNKFVTNLLINLFWITGFLLCLLCKILLKKLTLELIILFSFCRPTDRPYLSVMPIDQKIKLVSHNEVTFSGFKYWVVNWFKLKTDRNLRGIILSEFISVFLPFDCILQIWVTSIFKSWNTIQKGHACFIWLWLWHSIHLDIVC